jgi:hypothetical protein
VKLRTTISLLLGLFAICFAALAASAGEVTLLGNERIVFSTLFGNTSGVSYNSNTCFIPRRATGPNYDVDNEPYFDGPVAPITYSQGGVTKLRFNASVGYRNYEILSTLSGTGESATFTNGVLTCAPVYTASLDAANDTFAWGEWLYGTFRDVATGKVYSPIYNEYYGGHYPGLDGYSTYVATGLAVSTNNGQAFSKIQAAPGHVILRLPSLRQNTTDAQGLSWFGGIFKSPLDQMYYMGANDYYSGATAMVRTSNLDDPTSWRAWSGSNWDVSTAPLTQPFQGIGVNPLYLGFSDYFKKYIAVTIGEDANHDHLIVYNLSDDLRHWGPQRKLIYNPVCGPTHRCGDNPSPLSAYPAIMDPGYLSDTGNSTKASNGMTGMKPLVTYIKNFSSGSFRQQFAVQQVNFDQVVFNRMDNFSMRGIVGGGNQALVIGFIIQGTESKQFAFRGLGPSLPFGPEFGYPKISNPRISLYDGAGNLLKSNVGWTSLPEGDQGVLTGSGLQPGSTDDSAIVATLSPGNYTIQMDNGNGVGVIDGFDLSSTAEAKVVQVAVRGYSQPGNGALTLGLISRGGQTAVIRGTGASTLAPAGFSPVIPNPYVTVYNGAGSPIISNDNWGTDPNASTISSYGLAPGNSLESATMFSTQTPAFSPTAPNTVFSSYSAQLQGTGYGLLELYNVNPN